MLKTRLILIAVTAIIIWLLFLLPKAVVENESQLSSSQDSVKVNGAGAGHAVVPQTLSETIKSVRSQYLKTPQNEKNYIFADSLRDLYTQAGQFDSAAWFAGQAASFLNTTESFLKAGNSYYEAYTFAMDPAKQKTMADKTREFLGKALAANPKNLEAKTKIAMTYLSSSTPMQGITMMREVLEQDPKNEFAIFNMGMLSIQSGQYDKAIERFLDLIGVNPKHVQGQLLLGVAYLNKGDKKKAREQFEKVKQLDKDPSVQATVDSYLKELK
jgi:tetratricopeptide (TPR) repeat protein